MGTRWPQAESWSRCPMWKQPRRRDSWRLNLLLMSPASLKQLSGLKQILPSTEVSFEAAVLERYSGDKWLAARKPDAVVRPRSAKSVSAVLRFADRHNVPERPGGRG